MLNLTEQNRDEIVNRLESMPLRFSEILMPIVQHLRALPTVTETEDQVEESKKKTTSREKKDDAGT